MYRIFFRLILSLFPAFLYSQNFQIQGKLIDESENTPLESATIFAEKPADSSLITYTISGRNGEFELKGRTSATEINVTISYTGYVSLQKKVILNGTPINLGTLKMALQTESLEDVVVTATRAPITIKKDTMEFNAASFSTKKNATVEDLLKELPGVEVDLQGNITVNGKPVNKILVNGKPFFGDDPTIATRNLTKEIVNKIQVTDTKTDSQAFSGEKGDDENQTINITIDEGKNKGVFGRVAAGAGTDKRFEYAGLVNYFDNDLRLSALAGGNNINSPGFSFGEIEKMFGSARNLNFKGNGSFSYNGKSFGGGQGITNSRTMGANYADDFAKGTDISADYFYSAASTFNEEIRERENILPENRYFSNSSSRSESENDSHTANIRFKAQIDSTFLIEIRPQFTFNENHQNFTREEESRNISDELINQSNSKNQGFREGRNFENNLTATKKYGNGGGYFRLSVKNEVNGTKNDDFKQSLTQIFGDNPLTIDRNHFTDGDQDRNSYRITPSLRLPLIADTLFLNVGYTFESEKRQDRRSVFDFNNSTQEFSDFNLEQSTDFTNTNESATPEIGINYRNEKIYVRLNASYVFRTLESDDALRDFRFKNNFNALELSANIRYQFSKKFSLYSGYNLQNIAPNIDQLSPYVDISDPLNITSGNPDLAPSNEHSLYVGFNNYDFQSQTGFYSNINGSITNDRVVARTVIDENLVRSTTYTNVDGNYSLWVSFGFNKSIQLDSLRTFKYGANFHVNGNKGVNFNNDVKYNSSTINYGPTLNATVAWKDWFEIGPSYRISYSTNSFDIEAFEDRNYTRHEANLRTSTFFPKFLEWNNDIAYVYNADVAEGFDKNFVFWNSSLVYSFLKNSGSATLKVYDLLDQNNNVQRISNQDYIQDIQSTVLKQYFMLTLSCKFNTLGKKGEIKDNPWE